jgi:hypothetical protein
MTDSSSPKKLDRQEQMLEIISRIQSDPEFTRGAQENLDAALERAGLTETVAELKQSGDPETTTQGRCTLTCGHGLTCAITCLHTAAAE